MKKKIVPVVLVVVMLFTLLAACGTTTQPTKTEPSETANAAVSETAVEKTDTEQHVITVITVNDPAKLFHKELIPIFEQENPGAKVNLVEVPFDQFDTKIQTMLASKTPLDLSTHNGWTGFGARLANDQLLDLTQYIDKYGFNGEEFGIPKGASDIWTVNGKTYGIPVHIFPSFMLYNKDMFDNAGLAYPPTNWDDTSWTWDKMVEYAQALTKDIDDPMKAEYGLIWDWASGGNEQIPQYFGHMTFDEETFSKNSGFASQAYFDKPEIIADYQKIIDLTFKQKVSPSSAANEAMGGSAFFAGKAGMLVGGGWNIAGTNDSGFKVGIAAIPYGGNAEVRSVLWIDPYWIFKNSTEPDMAFKYIMFLVRDDMQKKMIEASSGLPPSNLNVFDTYAAFFKNIDPKDMKMVYEGGIEYGYEGMSHLMPDAASLNTLLSNEMGTMFNEGNPADTVMPGVQKKVEQFITDTKAKYKK